jgi:hypothetical protein
VDFLVYVWVRTSVSPFLSSPRSPGESAVVVQSGQRLPVRFEPGIVLRAIVALEAAEGEGDHSPLEQRSR